MARKRKNPRSPNDLDRIIADNIRRHRIGLEISQEKLAKALGLTFQQLQKYERATNRVPASRLYAISVELDVPVDWFFTDNRERPSYLLRSNGRKTQVIDAPLVAANKRR